MRTISRHPLTTLALAVTACLAASNALAQCPSGGDSPFLRMLKPRLFSAALDGAVKLSWNGATSALPAVGGGLAVTLSSGADSIFFVIPPGLTTGTYPFRDYRGAFDSAGKVKAVGGYFVHTPDRAKPVRYDTFQAGTLKILSTDPLTGTITLDSKTDGKRLTASAAFCELRILKQQPSAEQR